MEKNSAVVSHRKDADGITSAALVRQMSAADVYLTDYGDMVESLQRVKPAADVYICDLGLNPSTFEGFLKQVRRLGSHGRVHYIDHHPINPVYASKLREAGVDLYHSTEESAAVLVYKKYEEQLNSPTMKIAACCGAITDYLDSRPFARKLISMFDRQFLLFEATTLSFAIASIGRDSIESDSALVNLVLNVASGKLPHEISNAVPLALDYVSRSTELMKLLAREGKRRKNYAYFLTKESATGNVANFLIGAFEVPIGVSLREESGNSYEISLRSVEESRHDLGKIVGRISEKLNASGGGHPHASGARIERKQLDEFLSLLDEELSEQI